MAVLQYLERKGDYVQAIINDDPTIVGYNFPIWSILINSLTGISYVKIWNNNIDWIINSNLVTNQWKYVEYYNEDFFTSVLWWSTAWAGASVAIANNPINSFMGTVSLSTWTTNTWRATLATNNNLVLLWQWNDFSQNVIYLPALSTLAQRYTIRHWFWDNLGWDHTDWVYFEYDEWTAWNFWRICTASNTTRTKTTTTVPVVATTPYYLFIKINNGTQADYYINSVFVWSITTNIPIIAGRQTWVMSHIVKSLWNTAASVLIDISYAYCIRTTTRF